MSFNKVILMGNLTADPETRVTPGGQSVTSFTLAVNRTSTTSSGERREEVSYINCTAWGARGEVIAKYVGKGRQFLVSGRLQQRTWEDKDTGKKRSAIDVVVEDFSFINDGRNGSQQSVGSAAPTQINTTSEANLPDAPDDDAPIDLSDIPF